MSKANKRERQRQNRELAKAERERLMKRDRRMRTIRGLLFVLVPVLAIFLIYQFAKSDDTKSTAAVPGCTTVKNFKLPKRDQSQKAPALAIDPTKTYTATFDTTCGVIVTSLDAKTAPVATNNFVSLARSGFYNGLPFHRVVKAGVIQSGDPKGDGTGGPGYTVTGEVPTDNYPIGSLAAAKGGNDPNGTFGSQYFIVTGKGYASLPNQYARFGTVTKGLAVAKRIGSLFPKSGDGPPTQKVIVNKVTIAES